jgi:hypothetical protein
MISERTALHRPTIHPPGVRPSAALDDAVECRGIRSTGSPTRLWIVAATIALWRALTAWGNASFFELERPVAEHRQLGPGVSRVSDSFWPLTDW